MKHRPGRTKLWTAGLLCLALGTLVLFVAAGRSPLAQAPSQSPKPADSAADASADGKKAEEATPAQPAAQSPAPLDPAQAQLVADTEKLLKLSKELKAEVAKSNKDTLSITVIKKAEEIEKLAKSLKERTSKAR